MVRRSMKYVVIKEDEVLMIAGSKESAIRYINKAADSDNACKIVEIADEDAERVEKEGYL